MKVVGVMSVFMKINIVPLPQLARSRTWYRRQSLLSRLYTTAEFGKKEESIFFFFLRICASGYRPIP